MSIYIYLPLLCYVNNVHLKKIRADNKENFFLLQILIYRVQNVCCPLYLFDAEV